MFGVEKARSRASGGQIGASKALEGPGLFNFRGSLWFLLLDQSVGALKAWSLCASRLCPQIEVISPNKLVDPLGIEILEL